MTFTNECATGPRKEWGIAAIKVIEEEFEVSPYIFKNGQYSVFSVYIVSGIILRRGFFVPP